MDDVEAQLQGGAADRVAAVLDFRIREASTRASAGRAPRPPPAGARRRRPAVRGSPDRRRAGEERAGGVGPLRLRLPSAEAGASADYSPPRPAHKDYSPPRPAHHDYSPPRIAEERPEELHGAARARPQRV